MNQSSADLAQAVGLWLAEGDRKTGREVTFTNNQSYLISFFHETLWKYFHPEHPPRVAVYLPRRGAAYLRPVPHAKYNIYVDIRSTRPYYIYRVSGVELVKLWRRGVLTVCDDTNNYRPILQGFFAGEGNVKFGRSHPSRGLRISQGNPYPFLERILRHFGIPFHFGGHREYTISGRTHLETLLSLGITALHREKHEKFVGMMSSYRQRHYGRNEFASLLYSRLARPSTSRELAILLARGKSRVNQVLTRMKRIGIVQAFKVRSNTFWLRTDSNTIIISREKQRILQTLETPRKVAEIAESLSRNNASVYQRLHELCRLGLVVRVTPKWRRLPTSKRVIAK